MPNKPEVSRSDTSQRAKFEETAHALGCDEDEAAFDEKLKVVARQKPKDERKAVHPPKRSKARE